MKKICIVINARVNSSRCYKKMISPIGNTCLIEIIIEKLKKSNIPLEDIYIASPDIEIENIIEKHNFNFIKRSQESNNEEFNIKIIFEWYKKLENNYTHFLLINPCLPLLSVNTINNFYNICKESKYDRVFAIKTNKNYFFDENNNPLNFKPGVFNTKYVKGLKEAAHCLYFMKLQDIKENNYLGGFIDSSNPYLIDVEEKELYDIDYQYQFDIIKNYLENNINLLEYSNRFIIFN